MHQRHPCRRYRPTVLVVEPGDDGFTRFRLDEAVIAAIGPGEVDAAPLAHRRQHRDQSAPGVGEHVLGTPAVAGHLVVVLLQDPGGHQFVESRTQHVGRHTELLAEFGEPRPS